MPTQTSLPRWNAEREPVGEFRPGDSIETIRKAVAAPAVREALT